MELLVFRIDKDGMAEHRIGEFIVQAVSRPSPFSPMRSGPAPDERQTDLYGPSVGEKAL